MDDFSRWNFVVLCKGDDRKTLSPWTWIDKIKLDDSLTINKLKMHVKLNSFLTKHFPFYEIMTPFIFGRN